MSIATKSGHWKSPCHSFDGRKSAVLHGAQLAPTHLPISAQLTEEGLSSLELVQGGSADFWSGQTDQNSGRFSEPV